MTASPETETLWPKRSLRTSVGEAASLPGTSFCLNAHSPPGVLSYTYAAPDQYPLPRLSSAPTTAVSPEIETLWPNWSPLCPSPGTSLPFSTHSPRESFSYT